MVDMRVVKLQMKILAQSPNRARCHYCGKRMKFASGGLVGFAGREEFCRACGREAPELSELLDLTPEEWALIESYNPDKFPDIPECLGCGVKLQASADGTKVFCMRCGREWERFEFEDIMGAPIALGQFGMIPLPFDTSRTAQKLQERLDSAGVDSGSPFIVVEDFSDPSPEEKERLAGMKPKPQRNAYVALYSDYLARYVITGDQIIVDERPYADLVPGDDLESYKAPFSIALGRKDKKNFDQYLFDILHSFVINKKPYAPVLFGTAARDAALQAEDASTASKPSSRANSESATEHSVAEVMSRHGSHDERAVDDMVTQLERLFELHKAGAFTEEEYAMAKARLLS